MSEEVGEGEDKLGIAGVEQYNKAADAVQALPRTLWPPTPMS